MSILLTDKVKSALLSAPEGITLYITVGNSLRGDDGAGPFIASLFQENGTARLLDAGEKPENALDTAIDLNPKKVVIIDAADFGAKPGETAVIPMDIIPDSTLSTHTFPLPIIARMIEEDTGAEVLFLGIQPENVSLGEGMCDEVEKACRAILKIINKGAS